MVEVKELTKEQATIILNDIMSNEGFIGSGSSRAVYEYEYEGKRCVVKIACDRQGRFQNITEYNVFVSTEGSGYLAQIYAKYKDYFTIMEYIEPNRGFADDVYEGYFEFDEEDDVYEYNRYKDGKITSVTTTHSSEYGYDSYEALKQAVSEVESVIYFLSEIQGDTCDNTQIGNREDGSWAAYDYGYDTSVDGDDQVGDIDSFDDPIDYMYETIVFDKDINRYEDERTVTEYRVDLVDHDGSREIVENHFFGNYDDCMYYYREVGHDYDDCYIYETTLDYNYVLIDEELVEEFHNVERHTRADPVQ